jgi:hypothetical protein
MQRLVQIYIYICKIKILPKHKKTNNSKFPARDYCQENNGNAACQQHIDGSICRVDLTAVPDLYKCVCMPPMTENVLNQQCEMRMSYIHYFFSKFPIYFPNFFFAEKKTAAVDLSIQLTFADQYEYDSLTKYNSSAAYASLSSYFNAFVSIFVL